jgi:YjbE family integral membrane protein
MVFVSKLFTIVAANLVLSGDNAMVIALVASMLPPPLRMRALIAGAAGAVVVLVTATIFAAKLLQVRFLELAGGMFILWISVNLFRKNTPPDPSQVSSPSLWKAISSILIADVAMSIDNILAVAAVAQGDVAMLVLGLGVSIPFVVIASAFVANLMDQPVAVYLGAALLGKIGAGMIMTDSFTMQVFGPTARVRHFAEAATVAAVLVIGILLQTLPHRIRVSPQRHDIIPPSERRSTHA